jgi:arylsulfatase A-like enzyme
MKRRHFVKSVGFGLASAAFSRGRGASVGGIPRAKPNILFIMADDHTSQAIGCYGSRLNKTPNIDRIAAGGIRFDRCLCTNGICAPSRAVILTGKYSHLNGVRDNAQTFDGSRTTFPRLFQKAGYVTALIGKWHLKSDPAGFDYWNILPGQGEYYNPDFIEMGQKRTYPGYVTDIITDIVLKFLAHKDRREKPFLLMVHHKAPHRNWQPSPRHLPKEDAPEYPEPETLFDDYATRSRAAREQQMTLRDYMDIAEDLKTGTPPARLSEEQRRLWESAYAIRRESLRRENPQGDQLVRWKYRRYLQDYLACVAAVDESLGQTLDFLDRSGLAENTLVVYTSDQGFYLGEHGWFDKRFMYEESLRMPLLMRLPGVIRPGSVDAHLTSNLDFAPTLLDLAGLPAAKGMQGLSFSEILKGGRPKSWRTSAYYHYYEYPAVHMVKRHLGVRTERYKLIHFYYDIDAWELYDLEKDPHELKNVYDISSYAGIVRDLRAELKRLQDFFGDSDELARKFLKEDLARQGIRGKL